MPEGSGAPRNRIIRQNEEGNEGREVELISNSFKINFNKTSLKIYQYDLAIEETSKKEDSRSTNSVPSKFVCDEIYKELDLGSGWAYDGRQSLYHSSGKSVKITREIPVGRKKYKATVTGPVANTSYQSILSAIKQAGSVIPVDAVHALNIVLAQGFKNSGYIAVQRSFFSPRQEDEAAPFPGGLSLYSGISSSVTPSQGFGITIKVLKTHQVMYPGGSLLDFVKSNLNNGDKRGQKRPREEQGHLRSLHDGQIKLFNGILKGLKVETTHLGYKRKYTLTGMHHSSARDTILRDLDISVARYFEKTYNINLKYKDLPLVMIGPKTKLPIELCDLLPNQPYFNSLNSAQQRDMIRQASQAPSNKLRDIRQSAKDVDSVTYRFTKSHFGFEIDPRAIEVSGRVLPSPKPGGESVRNGAWRMSSVKKAGHISGDIKLGVVSMVPHRWYTREVHDKFTDQISARATSLGMGRLVGSRLPLIYSTRQSLDEDLQDMGSKYNFIIIDDNCSENEYGNVKLMELLERKTQCIKLSTVKKICGMFSKGMNNRPQRPDINTTDNILKKLNVKVGGINFGVYVEGLPKNIFKDRVMIVGADVTHFTRSDNKPSIAAVVATIDKYGAKYVQRVKPLYPEKDKLSVEYITCMKNIMIDLLKEFGEANKHNRLPHRIIYYRDGVSEGQFENTVMEELGGIQDACMELKPDYTPSISVVVCTKRHKQRFVVKGQRGEENMEPGTVIDTGVVAPNYMNFYLNSQQAINRNSVTVPCHYYVLYDDNKLTMDMWQMLSFYLCHSYARCSRSVSYPAPVYYAHLACASARARMCAAFDWHTLDERPTTDEIERKSVTNPFRMFFI